MDDLRDMFKAGSTLPVSDRAAHLKHVRERVHAFVEDMQQHLAAAGGQHLDFGPMDRLLSLRPLLSLLPLTSQALAQTWLFDGSRLSHRG